MRILVVDDNSDIRHYIQKNLEQRKWSVDAVADGEHALFLAQLNEYDAIILDFDIPKRNGFDICLDLRKNHNHTPIIVISVTAAISHKVSGFDAGIDDYITKPFHFEELYARLQSLLRRPRHRESTIYTLDTLQVDTERHYASRGGTHVYLTRKEFMLLELLIKHAKTVVPRSKIVEHVWDADMDPFSNTLESHIRNLRRKIDFPPHKKLLFNIPGRGYKLDTER